MMWSNPENFNSGAKNPPAFASPCPMVRGERAVTVNLQPAGSIVPAKGPVPKISLFSGLKGSTPGFTSSYKILELIPLAPMNFFAKSSFNSSSLILLLVRSTRNIFPAYPKAKIVSLYSTVSYKL